MPWRGWELPGSFEEQARRRGFLVFKKTVVYTDLTGNSVRESRVTGYNREMDVKISYTRVEGGEKGMKWSW
jgi:hypothetical protein